MSLNKNKHKLLYNSCGNMTILRKCFVSRVKGSTYWLTKTREMQHFHIEDGWPYWASCVLPHLCEIVGFSVEFCIRSKVKWAQWLCLRAADTWHQTDALLKDYWRKSFSKTGMVWILQMFLILETIVFLWEKQTKPTKQNKHTTKTNKQTSRIKTINSSIPAKLVEPTDLSTVTW